MDADTKIMEKRTDKIKKWLKDPYVLILIGILVLTLLIRVYYFVQTQNQPLWWDEAEYMATAKHWAFNVPYNLGINPQRPPLFQMFAALSYIIGLGDNFIKFAFSLIPSVFLVFAIYLLGKEMFNKKVALVASLFAAVSWTFIFWSARIQPDFLSMSFQVLAVLFMWKYWKTEKTSPIIWAGIFAALGFYFKVSALLVPVCFIIFILIKDRFSALKNKNYYYFSLSFLLTLVPYFIWSYLNFGNITAFKANYSNAFIIPTPFGWYNINFFYSLTEGILFILFLIGVFISLKFLLYLDVLVKDKKKCFSPEIFSLIVLVVVSAFYIFYIRYTEDRWVFLWLPFIFILAGKTLFVIYDFVKKYSKTIGFVVIVLVLGFIMYNQLVHANDIIEIKKDSYMPVKLGGLWIKANSSPGDKVLSISYTQTIHYSERNVTSYSDWNQSYFENFLKTNKPKFLMISAFEKHPDWIYSWPQGRSNVVPVQIYFADATNKQALLVIYKISYDNNTEGSTNVTNKTTSV